MNEYSITFTGLLEEAYKMRAKNSIRDLSNYSYQHLEPKDKREYIDSLIERSGEKPVDDTIEVDNIEKLKQMFGQR